MNVTVLLPIGWPSYEVLNGLSRFEIQAEGATLTEVLKDAACKNEFIRSAVHVVCVDETLRNSVYVYLHDKDYRRHPLLLDTPVADGDTISIKFRGM